MTIIKKENEERICLSALWDPILCNLTIFTQFLMFVILINDTQYLSKEEYDKRLIGTKPPQNEESDSQQDVNKM